MGAPATESLSLNGCVTADVEDDSVEATGEDGAVADAVEGVVGAVDVEAPVEAKVVRRGAVLAAAPEGAVTPRVLAARVLAPAVTARDAVAAPRTGRAWRCFFSSQRFHATSTIEALKMDEYKPDAIPINIASTKL